MRSMEQNMTVKYKNNRELKLREHGFRITISDNYEQEILETKSRRNWLWMHSKVQGRGMNQGLSLPKNTNKVQQQYADLAFYTFDLEKHMLAIKLKHKKEMEDLRFEHSNFVLFTTEIFDKHNIPDDDWDLLNRYSL